LRTLPRKWYQRYDCVCDRVLSPYDEAYWTQVWWQYVAGPVYRALVLSGLWVLREGDLYVNGVWVFDATPDQLRKRSLRTRRQKALREHFVEAR